MDIFRTYESLKKRKSPSFFIGESVDFIGTSGLILAFCKFSVLLTYILPYLKTNSHLKSTNCLKLTFHLLIASRLEGRLLSKAPVSRLGLQLSFMFKASLDIFLSNAFDTPLYPYSHMTFLNL
jgi:hypothetical protein